MSSDSTRTPRIAAGALAIVNPEAELPRRHVGDCGAAAQQGATWKSIVETPIIRLSVEDQRAFAAAILDPPPPSLIGAAEVHRRLIRDM